MRHACLLFVALFCTATHAQEGSNDQGTDQNTAEPRPQRMLTVELVEIVLSDNEAAEELDNADDLTAAVRRLQASDKVKILQRLSLATLEGQETMAQFGKQIAMVTGVMVTGGREMQRTTNVNVGTLAKLRSEFEGDDVLLELTFESSRHEPASDDDGLQAAIVTTTIETTLKLALGEPVLVSGQHAAEQSLLVATVNETRGRRRSARLRPNVPSRFKNPGENGSSSSRPKRDRFEQYAEAIVARYDKNEDGVIDEAEVADTRFGERLKRYDADEDGKLTVKELVESFRGR